jgi:hypothetical protein
MQLDFTVQFQLGDATEVFDQNFFFDFQLMVVGGVLIVASSASPKVRARWRDAMWRGIYNRARAGARKARFLSEKRGLNFFPGKDERNKYGFAAATVVGRKASKSVAAIDELLNV